jgi:hypothetical protein
MPTLTLTLTFRQLRSIATVRRIWRMVDWLTVAAVAIAGAIALVVMTVRGIRATYGWAQPRLAALLAHPGQTLRHGPAAVYCESVGAVLTGTATPLERAAVAVGAWVILRAGEAVAAVATVLRWRDGLTVEAVEAWALAQLGR